MACRAPTARKQSPTRSRLKRSALGRLRSIFATGSFRDSATGAPRFRSSIATIAEPFLFLKKIFQCFFQTALHSTPMGSRRLLKILISSTLLARIAARQQPAKPTRWIRSCVHLGITCDLQVLTRAKTRSTTNNYEHGLRFVRTPADQSTQ